MASFTKRGNGQWQAKIRRKGWPAQSGTFKTKKLAEAWAHKIESEMAGGHFVDRTPSQRTTLRDLIETYLREVTDQRPGESSRYAERKRLARFMREEKELCAYAVANLTPEQFETYRDKRLATTNKSGNPIAAGTVKRELGLPPLKWSSAMFRKTEDELLPGFGPPGWRFSGGLGSRRLPRV